MPAQIILESHFFSLKYTQQLTSATLAANTGALVLAPYMG